MAQTKDEQLNKNLKARPPIVVVMGHVDHGKTSILDYIRKAKVVAKESGGITQHMGAYEVEHNASKITFIDTPGHEAFYAMRSRGARVADVAVLVVAADDGIMPQTKEAIKHIKQAGIPMIVAVNKIDKQNADTARIKNQLLEEGVIIEEFKGIVPLIETSAATGQGIDDLLETISLVAEVEEIKADFKSNAEGVVVESELNAQRGPTAILLIKNGILQEGDIIALSSCFGKVRNLENFKGEPIREAFPGSPAFVVGLPEVPQVGEKFEVKDSIEEARARVESKQRKFAEEARVLSAEEGKRVINIVLAADVRGTLEAAHELIRGIESEDVIFRILSQSLGEIMENDIKLAAAANAILVGFRTSINSRVKNFAQQMGVEVVTGDVIYELVESLRAKVADILSTKKEEIDTGGLKVLAVFRTEKSRMIVGGKVLDGEIKRGSRVRVIRKEEKIGDGRVAQLKIRDKAVDRVEKGQECGLLFEGDIKILTGDILQAHEKRDVKIDI